MVEDFFESYEPTHEDASLLKKDLKNHPRESYASLRSLARILSVTPEDTVKRREIQRNLKDPYKRAPNKAQYWPKPSHTVRRELDYAIAWLSAHQSEIPAEIERENGDRGSRRETNGHIETDKQDTEFQDDVVFSKYERHGMFNTEHAGCMQRLGTFAAGCSEDVRSMVGAYGPYSPVTMQYLLRLRGEAYARYRAKQSKRLRWRGMEGAQAGENMTKLLDKLGGRKRTASNAKPLPANLNELLAYDEETDTLTWKVTRSGPVREGAPLKGKDVVTIEGARHKRHRVVYALQHGDPKDLNVHADGTATAERKQFAGSIVLRSDGNYDVQAYIGDQQHMVLEASTEQDAEFALWCTQWAVRNHK